MVINVNEKQMPHFSRYTDFFKVVVQKQYKMYLKHCFNPTINDVYVQILGAHNSAQL